MISYGEKCRHCHASMSQPKLVLEGPKKGQVRTVCSHCGHLEYRPAPDPGHDQIPSEAP